MIIGGDKFSFDAYQAGDYGDHVIIHGDCLEVMKQMPDKCVDLVVTDPQYGTGGRSGAVHLNDNSIRGNRWNRDTQIWVHRQFAGECYRCSASNVHSYVFCDWRGRSDIQIAWESAGWESRSLLVWDKTNGMGEYWRSSHEMILWMTKLRPRNLTGGGFLNVFSFPTVRTKKKHPAQKPVDLICHLIQASGCDLVLDPFLGSGTTLVAAKQLGRRGIGIEIERKYCEIAEERLKQEVLSL